MNKQIDRIHQAIGRAMNTIGTASACGIVPKNIAVRLSRIHDDLSLVYDEMHDLCHPYFKVGDKVHSCLGGKLSGKVGTIVKAPTRRSRGIVFGGEFAYDVDFDGLLQRLGQSDLVSTGRAAKSGR